MKKRAISLLSSCLFLISCGSSLQDTSSAPESVNYNPVERSYLVFDPFSKEASSPLGIPFPNDLFWKGGVVEFELSSSQEPKERALYQAVNQLKVKGLSPNTPIFIPLSSSKPVDLSSLKGRFFLFDLTLLREALSKGEPEPSLITQIDQSSRLYPSQEGSYLKFYPVKPLEAGHQYLFVLLDGITDSDGLKLLPPQLYNQLESDKPLKEPELEKLRELYRSQIYQGAFPALNRLFGLSLNEESVSEAFTFTTADKSLSVKDFSEIKKFLSGEVSELKVEGLPYDR